MVEIPQLTEKVRKLLLWLVAAAFFMQMLDGTILNTALPVMSQSFGQSPLRMQSVVIAYLLTVAILIPLSGWASDRFGSRRIFLISLCFFTFGSLLCALSWNLPMLIASRIVQGVGGSMMTPVGRLIAIRIYPRDQIIKTLTFITIPALVGPILGPVLGGFFVQYVSWHWIFLVNLPLGLLGIVITLRFMPEMRSSRQVPFDWCGFALFGGAMISVSLSLEGAGELHWHKLVVLLLFVLGGASFVTYWVYAARREHPLFTTELFRNRAFTVGILGNLFARLSNGSIPYLTPLMFQFALGFSPLFSGLTLMPLAVAGMIAKMVIEPLIRLCGHRVFLLINTVLLGALIAGLACVSHETPYGFLLLHLTILGMVNSMQFTAMNTLALGSLSVPYESAGNGLLSVVIQIASSFGIGISAMLLTLLAGVPVGAEPGDPLPVFHRTFLCMGAIACLSSVIFFFAPKREGFSETESPVAESREAETSRSH